MDITVKSKLFKKIADSLDYKISAFAIQKIIEECYERDSFYNDGEGDLSFLLNDGITISISETTGDVDIIDKDNMPFGIFWSFDRNTGMMTGT